MCEAVYAPSFDRMCGDVGSLASVLGMERPLTDVSLHSAAGQRYIVGHSPLAMYVAFQGTKQVRDWAANLSFMHAPLWQDAEVTKRPAAHGGFSSRSVAVPLEEIYRRAVSENKRLVLCGHSLGGAVALLCTVKLLRIWAANKQQQQQQHQEQQKEQLAFAGIGIVSTSSSSIGPQLLGAAAAASAPQPDDPNIRCITFAAPAVANEALAAEVVAAGWDRLISNFVQPEDVIVPFVNKLLKAEEGSAALARALHRVAKEAKAAAAEVALKQGSRSSTSSGASSLIGVGSVCAGGCDSGSGGCGLSEHSSTSSDASSSGRCSVDTLGSSGGGGGSSGGASTGTSGPKSCLHKALSYTNLGSLSASSFRRAANATASVAAALVSAAAAVSQAHLHSKHLADSAYKQTAAVVSLSMASACNLPAAETLGNAPHAPKTARLLRHSSSGTPAAEVAGDAGSSGVPAGVGPNHSVGAAALQPARELQGGLSMEALVAAAEAGVIGLSDISMNDLAPEDRRRLDGSGWLAWRGNELSGWLWRHDEVAEDEAEEWEAAEAAGADVASSDTHTPVQEKGAPASQTAQRRQQQQQDVRDSRLIRRAKSAFDVRSVVFEVEACGGSSTSTSGDVSTSESSTSGSPREAMHRQHQQHQFAKPPLRNAFSFSHTSTSASSPLSRSSLPLSGAAAAAAAAARPSHAHVHARAAAMLTRRGPSIKQRVVWGSTRAAALASPAGAMALTSALAGGGAAAPALVSLLLAALPWLLALPAAAVIFEMVCCLIVIFVVPRTYTIGQQWVLTHLGMEPALKPLHQYPRNPTCFGQLGGLFPGHRMKAYRARLMRLLPGNRLARGASYARMSAAATAAADRCGSKGAPLAPAATAARITGDTD